MQDLGYRLLTPEERARAVALLEATHEFPVAYTISVIALNIEMVSTAVRVAAEEGLDAPLPDGAYRIQPSAQGKYLSHRIDVPCREAGDVLRLYHRMRSVEGVVTVI